MRLVFVNYTHPDVLHVSAMRLGCFAKEMARRGHQVVLLVCSDPNGQVPESSGECLAARLSQHEWSEPLVVAVAPRPVPNRPWFRRTGTPRLLRRAHTLWNFLVHGGTFVDWYKAAKPTMEQLARDFHPQLVWGTFGNTTNLTMAKSLAHQAECSWLMDIKDNWEVFIPRLLRRWMAWCFRNALAWTSNSEYHRDVAIQWFPKETSEVLYSGVPDAFFPDPLHPQNALSNNILLVGSIYDGAALRKFLEAVRWWLDALPERDRAGVRFTYAGSDSNHVLNALNVTALPCETEVHAQLTIPALASHAKAAFVNTYIFKPSTFHQKLLELLVCGKPVICFPGASPEDLELAAQTETLFLPCESAADVCEALDLAWIRRGEPGTNEGIPAWRWSNLSERLETVLLGCIQDKPFK